MTIERRSYRLRNDLQEIERAAEIVAAFGAAHHLSSDDLFALNLSLEEVLTNVIHYAYDPGTEHTFDLRLTLDDALLTVEVEDGGRAFNPLDRADPDIDQPLEERPIGGLGIYLVRQLMDEVHYCRQADHNLLTLKKRLIRAAP